MIQDKHHHTSDQELLEKYAQTGDNGWLGILLQRYTLLLYGVCMKYVKNESEAKDCVQQIFVKVIQEVGKYRVDYFKSWLYMVAKNHCLTLLRDKKGKKMETVAESNIFVADEEDPYSRNGDVPVELLKEALDHLNNEQKQCVTLFYLQKQSYQQISSETGYSLLQVKSYIQNGKRNLKIFIEKKLREIETEND